MNTNVLPLCEELPLNSEGEQLTLHIKSATRQIFTVHLVGHRITSRDVYIEVSKMTSVSKLRFDLYFANSKLPDTLVALTEFDITNGATFILHVKIQSGNLYPHFTKLPKSRQAVRKHVYAMSPNQIKKFFAAQLTIQCRIPVAHTMGTLRFKLHDPLPDDPNFYDTQFDRIEEFGYTQKVGNGMCMLIE